MEFDSLNPYVFLFFRVVLYDYMYNSYHIRK